MASVGLSKFGALLKLKAPADELIANLDASAPPFNDQVTVSFASKVLTAVPFSLIDTVLVDAPASLPDGPVIVGDVLSAVVKLREVVSLIPA